MSKYDIRVFEVLGYAVIVQKYDTIYRFKIHELAGIDSLSNEPFYEDKTSNEITTKIKRSNIFLKGEVKWDGCSDWDFVINKKSYIHCCSIDSIMNISLVMSKCYDIAKNEMDGFYD